MGTLDVTGWPATKIQAAVDAMKAVNPHSRIKIVWTPPPTTRTGDLADETRRLALVRDRLKG